ncbi:MAG: biotin carboxylase [Deltaproteobacteria bacterium]|nr:biotin carboxylase [Deltaproteobacteria bacterium]
MFRKLLVANRGEIACRVIRSARKLGVETVAIYSDADEKALHRYFADEAYRVGEGPSLKSYLNVEAILDVARKTGAGAIHPGYGFLSENADFARRVRDSGLVWVGPSPEVITLMGDKVRARETMSAAGVPVVPGTLSPVAPEQARAEADRIGFPVLIKAVGGGGGIGMQVAEGPEQLVKLVEAASERARRAFCNGAVYLERYLERPRHVEVQVFGELDGTAHHIFERECSVQRRHQKVIEESPSPLFVDGLNADVRRQLLEAAREAARAVGYVNAGTCEFLVDQKMGFYFLEMNTRLQVEHPVTEMTTGLDLVEMQLRVAAGQPSGMDAEALEQRGSAIECRIYAEDPAKKFMPSPGLIEMLAFPEGEGVRVDSGVQGGYTVSPFYDPMVAKISAWGTTRAQALERIRGALEVTRIKGIKTNIAMHLKILASDAFQRGELDTGALERGAFG